MNLRNAQIAAFHMLQYTDKICKDCDCHYFIDAGTLLGAIRHKKFIPWDDDIDILMFRNEYEKLKKHCLSGKLPAEFEITNTDNNINGFFFDFIPRITIKDSRYHAESASDQQFGNQQNRMGTDIFILDTVPENRIGCMFFTFMLKFFYGLAMGHRGILKPKKNGLAVIVLSSIGHCLPLRFITSLRERFIKTFANIKSSRIMATNYIMRDLGKTYRREWFAETILADFESAEFPAPVDYDNVLKAHYGNYMELPPENQRVPEHAFEGFQVPDWMMKEVQ